MKPWFKLLPLVGALACASAISQRAPVQSQPVAQDPPPAAGQAAGRIRVLSQHSDALVEQAGSPSAQTVQAAPTTAPTNVPPAHATAAQARGRRSAMQEQPIPMVPGAHPRMPQTTAAPPPAPPTGRATAPEAASRADQAARRGRAAARSSVFTQPAAVAQSAPSGAGDDETGTPNPAEARRKRLEARYATSRASRSPQDAGIPLGKGSASAGQRAGAARASRGAAVPAAGVAAAAGVMVAGQQAAMPSGTATAGGSAKPTPPVKGGPLENELVRAGDGFMFNGTLNGKPVRFLLTEKAQGLTIPTPIALAHGLIAPTSPAAASGGEVFTPVQSMAVGRHPITAAMARIVASKGLFVEIGVDALQAFKVVNQNGRLLLIPNPT